MNLTWAQVLAVTKEVTVADERTDGTFYVLCPFHSEKTASCVLRSGRNGKPPWYFCYGCHGQGSLPDFLAWFGLEPEDVPKLTIDPRQEKLL